MTTSTQKIYFYDFPMYKETEKMGGAGVGPQGMSTDLKLNTVQFELREQQIDTPAIKFGKLLFFNHPNEQKDEKRLTYFF